MNVLIDTSTLFKKYIDESGADEFAVFLQAIHTILIAPTTILEINSVITRRLTEKSLSLADAKWLESEFLYDYQYFGIVKWNDLLVSESKRIIRKHKLKILDSIQLASAITGQADLLLTSDKQLCSVAKKESIAARYI
ncbi:MAG: type II toxin-antitoxin system VapC family toxin [Deltaproteobacteria bacterium]|nr:type II toxin-antitoxin system VapC family toxin [Deltaproteobacteria bacterium]